MEWETSKENFQPLKQGRDPNLLTLPEADVKQKLPSLEAERRRYWKELEEYNGPDPLSVWLRLIKWTQETFKAGGHKAELLPLLERCTRELQANDIYKQDVRYLRVWIQYADCLSEPRDVFGFLQDHAIGQDFALFYIAYAAYLELRGNYAKADAVYQLGLERMAHPVDRLRTKYLELQMRMARRIERQGRDADGLPGPSLEPQDENAAVRTALTRLRTSVRPGAPGSAAALPPTGIRPKRKAVFPAGPALATNSSGLDIYVDDEFKSGQATAQADEFGLRRRQGPFVDEPPALTRLPTLEQTRKENVQQPSIWAGKTLKQKKALLPSVMPALDIPIDDDLVASPPPTRPAEAPKGTLRQRLETSPRHHLDEELQHDPLRLHKEPLSLDPQMPRPAASEERNAKKRRGKNDEQQGYDTTLFGGAVEVEDLSFEEVHAAAWLAKASSAMAEPGSPSRDVDMIISPICHTGADPSPGCQPLAHVATDHTSSAGPPAMESVTMLPSVNREKHLADGGPADASARTPCAAAHLPAAQAAGPSMTACPPWDMTLLGQSSSVGAGNIRACAALAAIPDCEHVSGPFVESNRCSPVVGGRSAGQHEQQAQATVSCKGGQDSRSAGGQWGLGPDLRTISGGAGKRAPLGEVPVQVPLLGQVRALGVAGKGGAQSGAISMEMGLADGDQMLTRTTPRRPVRPKRGACKTLLRTESDVTIATQEAFAAVNSMFTSPEQHGLAAMSHGPTAESLSLARPKQRPDVALHPPALQRDITITTRDAFDTINAMFNGVLPVDAPWRGGDPRLPPHPAADPTVTIATQAAFDAINGMMGAEEEPAPLAPAPESRTPPLAPASPTLLARPAARRPCQPLMPVRDLMPSSPQGLLDCLTPSEPQAKVRRLSANHRRHSQVMHPVLDLHEDTALLSPPKRMDSPEDGALPAASPLFAMYEDTALLVPGSVGTGVPLAEPTQFMTENLGACRLANQSCSGVNDMLAGLGEQHEIPVYEDTTLLSGPPAGLDVPASEPTQFMVENVGALRLGHQHMPGGGTSCVGHELGDIPLIMYEDTEFIVCAREQQAGLGIYEDTQFLTTAPDGTGHVPATVGPSSPADVYADTEFMDENVAPAHPMRRTEHPEGIQANALVFMKEDSYADGSYPSSPGDQENQPPPGAPVYLGKRRDVNLPAVAASVMQELPVDRLAALNITLAPKRRLFGGDEDAAED